MNHDKETLEAAIRYNKSAPWRSTTGAMIREAFEAGVAYAREKHEVEIAKLKEEHQALIAPLIEALEELLGCPISVDEATVPKVGVHEAPPYQVVVNASIAWTRLQKAREVLKNYKKQAGGE